MSDPTASAERDRTLDYLESQSEKTRAEFADTLDKLRHRLSPGAMTSGATTYVGRTGQGVLSSIEQKARDNPLQAVAVGAGLAYPVWRVLRHLPAPILLLGAGVALAGRGGAATASDRSYRTEEVVGGDTSTRYRSAHETQEQHTGEAAASVSMISAGAEAAAERVSDAVSSVVGSAGHLASATSDFAASSYRSGVDASSHVGGRAASVGRASRDGLVEAVENHPLLVGGISVLMGAALAACLPSSRTESRLFGEASDRVKDQARTSASHGLNVAKAAGERILENTLDEAQEQGLTAEDGRKAVSEIGDKARAVADRATKAVASEDATASIQGADKQNKAETGAGKSR